MAGSRDRPEVERGGPRELVFGAYGSLYATGGARGTSGADGTDSLMAPVVGGGICWLCRRRWDEARERPFVAGAAATERAVLLGMVLDMAAEGAASLAGWASTGRR